MKEFLSWFAANTGSSCSVADSPGFKDGCHTTWLSPDTWPYIANVYYPFIVLISYLLIALIIGPWLARNRDPLPLVKVLAVYNSFLGLGYFVIGAALVYCMIQADYSFLCQPAKVTKCVCSEGENFVKAPEDVIAFLILLYHIAKVVQLGEALFLILEQQRVSLVYVVHQVCLVGLTWGGAMFVPGGTTAVLVVAGCTAFPLIFLFGLLRKPGWPTYNVFGSYVQIIQFTFLALIAVMAYLMDCNYPAWASVAVISFVVLFAIMITEELSWVNGVFIFGGISFKETGFGAPWFHSARDLGAGAGDGGGGDGDGC